MTIRPLPPESTTPACFSTGSMSGVRFRMASPLFTAMVKISMMSSLPVKRDSTSSAITRATVRMVPSLGFMTALYAVCAPARSAFTSSAASMSSCPSRAEAMPRRIWLRITPELPRAPRSAPRAAALATSDTLFSSFTAAFIV